MKNNWTLILVIFLAVVLVSIFSGAGILFTLVGFIGYKNSPGDIMGGIIMAIAMIIIGFIVLSFLLQLTAQVHKGSVLRIPGLRQEIARFLGQAISTDGTVIVTIEYGDKEIRSVIREEGIFEKPLPEYVIRKNGQLVAADYHKTNQPESKSKKEETKTPKK